MAIRNFLPNGQEASKELLDDVDLAKSLSIAAFAIALVALAIVYSKGSK